MKKVLSVILILAIIFSLGILFGCANDEDPVSDDTTPDDSAPDNSSTPDETSPESSDDPYAEMYAYLGVDSVPDPEYSLEMYNRLMEGDIQVAFLALELTQNFIKRMADGFVEFWEEKGASGQVISADGDLTVQATQIENAGTQGIDLICIATSSPPTLAATCEAVMADGMQVIVRGQTKIEDCGFIPTGIEAGASREYGWYMADMVVYYMNTYNPHIEQIKVATGELSAAAQPTDILNGAKDRLALEDNTEVVYTMDYCFSIDDGYLTAEEALTFDAVALVHGEAVNLLVSV